MLAAANEDEGGLNPIPLPIPERESDSAPESIPLLGPFPPGIPGFRPPFPKDWLRSDETLGTFPSKFALVN